LLTNDVRGRRRQLAVRRRVEPTARTRRMRQRDDRRAVELVPAADALPEDLDPEQALDRKPADGNDEARAQDAQLPRVPERAELLLPRARRPIAPSGRRAARIAARHRRAAERAVKRLPVQPQPTPERLAGTSAPRPALFAFDEARRLPVHVRALIEAVVAHGP